MSTNRTIVAERELRTSLGDGSVVIRVHLPQADPDGGWTCNVSIFSGGSDSESLAFGEDSLQALLMGVSMLRARLQPLHRSHGLTWLGAEDLGLELEPRRPPRPEQPGT